MKLVTFDVDGRERFGAVEEDRVYDLTNMEKIPGVKATPPPASVVDILVTESAGLAVAEKAVEIIKKTKIKSRTLGLAGLKLKAPVPRPSKLLCLAGNYSKHITESGMKDPGKSKLWPRIFMKPPGNTIIGSGEAVVIPPNGNKIDWECELGVVIARRARFVEAAEALDYVGGYTVVNDISERELKVPVKRDETEWNDFFDWLNGKWFDTFAPMGPCLTTKDEIADPQDLRVTLRLNGQTRQDTNTKEMIFSVAELIEWASAIFTLEPGDVIATGTPSGVGYATGTFLKPGDVIEAEVEKIGVLKNPVAKGE
jgi:2-keto-4-pentenoate hydratase/2-oxohepta-3-ene-1,7-dioic acid hydratase in catechol pathway